MVVEELYIGRLVRFVGGEKPMKIIALELNIKTDEISIILLNGDFNRIRITDPKSIEPYE